MRERFAARGHALLEVRPETGRTHQIRVHLAASGLPIAGDPVYGRARARRRPAARRGPRSTPRVLGFTHPRSGARLRFEAPLPDGLRAPLLALAARDERRARARAARGARRARTASALRGTAAPPGTLRPRQVHGARVARGARAGAPSALGEADAVGVQRAGRRGRRS